ncbi:MAG: hypothetical protein ACWA5L_02995 [bacterium]
MPDKLKILTKPLAGALLVAASVICLNSFIIHQSIRQGFSGAVPDPLPSQRPAQWYAEVADFALTQEPADFTLITKANMMALQQRPHDVSTWNRIAYADMLQHGHLTQNGLAALYHSFQVAPFGDLSMMTWRLDLATANWTALPDDLQQKALAQIEIIGHFGTSWDWRIRNCKYNPYPEIYQAVCAISPGVVRTKVENAL